MAVALVVEDGTGLAAANTPVSVADALTILSDRGYSAFAASAAQEWDLVCATIDVQGWLDGLLDGSPLVRTQGLYYPRSNSHDHLGRDLTGVPETFREAVAIRADDLRSGAGGPAKKEAARVVSRGLRGSSTTWSAGADLEDYDSPVARKLAAQLVAPRQAFARS